MARTNVDADIISLSPGVAYDLTNSTDYIELSSGLGFGIEFTWKSNLLIFLYNLNDPSGVGFTVTPEGDDITNQGGIITPWFATASPGGWQHIFQPHRQLRQANGLMFIDALFTSYALIIEL